MIPTNPISEAREALDALSDGIKKHIGTLDGMKIAELETITAALDYAQTQAAEIERLTAQVASLTKERDDQHTMTNRWGYNAQRARDDVRTLLRIDAEMEYGKNSQKNLDALEEIRSRYANDGDEYRRPELLDELAALKVKLAKAEEVMIETRQFIRDKGEIRLLAIVPKLTEFIESAQFMKGEGL